MLFFFLYFPGGEIAGIAIGILAFVGLTAAASCFLYSRCQKTKKASVGTESAYDNVSARGYKPRSSK